MNKKNNRAMAALLAEDEIPAPPQPGQPVTGKVVNISNNRILVEIDGTYTGIIAGREAVDGFETAKKLLEGDEVTAYVVEEENMNGYYILSLRKASREKAWVKMDEMRNTDETIEVTIREANKGGLMTDFNGIRAFIPVSQLAPEHYPRVNGANASEILSKLQKFVGEKFVVQVLTAEPDENKLILSEKAGLAKKRSAAISKLSVGQKISGKVTGIVNFGIFVMFGDGLEGLVHLSEVAWGKVTDAANYAKVGEDKEAVVIGISPDKISLSMKRLTTDPWLKNIEKYSVGDVVSGAIEKITPFGALVSLGEDVSGLLHASENEEESEFAVGDEVTAKIIEVNPDDHRIALSMKGLEKSEKPGGKKAPAKKEEGKDEEEEKEKKEEKPKKKATSKKEEKKEEKEE